MRLFQNTLFRLAGIILIATVTSFIVTPLSIWIARKLNIIDYPSRSTHSIHEKPTPRAGGITIALGLVIVASLHGFWTSQKIMVVLIPTAVIICFALWDDRFGMDAPVKFAGQMIASTLLIILGMRVMFLENSGFFIQVPRQFAYWLDIFLTYFWMIGITNAVNMIDSSDGLANGICSIISAFFMVLLVISDQIEMAYLMAGILGISIGFFFFNQYPARTFLGDSGAQSLGFILAAVALAYHPQETSQASSWFAPILFFSTPIFDTTLVTFSRLFHKVPFYKGQLDHTFHRLIKMGWLRKKATAIIHLVQIVCCLIAVRSIYLKPTFANLIYFLWLAVFSVMLALLYRVKIFYNYD